ncbi:MAG: p-cumate 2,3-dioxygenase subunit beta, partial [Pseudonocardiales bacterium]|nr:p-cumate 2,3-dioxygenase subunit beta [Pseudonocardiales bacterium]
MSAPDMVTVPADVLARIEVEDFLYREAALLDEWRLEEWLDLFTLDCV